jgi:thymidine phosphorylase
MIAGGQAKVKFRQSIALQRGDPRVVEEPGRLPQARSRADVPAEASGFIAATNCENLGIALTILGGGREKKEDQIDHAVGLEFHVRVGELVEKGQPLATIHYNADGKLAEAKSLIGGSYEIAAAAPELPPLIRRVIRTAGADADKQS